mgnify:CR=1 FL=1
MNWNSWQTVPWNPLPANTIGIISIEANDAYLFFYIEKEGNVLKLKKVVKKENRDEL